MHFPENLSYSESHEWISVEGDTATLGITDFAQSELGDIIYFEPQVEVGETVEVSAVLGTIEAVKTVSELYSPISGKILEVNNELDNNFDKINTDPYGEGWMVKIKLSDPDELGSLLSHSEYKTMVEEE